MGTPYRACVDERGRSGSKDLEEDTRHHAKFLSPEKVLRLVEYICRGTPTNAQHTIVGVRYVIPLLSFVNGVEWTFVFLNFTGHLR